MSNKAKSLKYATDLETYRNFICKYCEKDFFHRHDLYFHFINQHTVGGVINHTNVETVKEDLDNSKI